MDALMPVLIIGIFVFVIGFLPGVCIHQTIEHLLKGDDDELGK